MVEDGALLPLAELRSLVAIVGLVTAVDEPGWGSGEEDGPPPDPDARAGPPVCTAFKAQRLTCRLRFEATLNRRPHVSHLYAV